MFSSIINIQFDFSIKVLIYFATVIVSVHNQNEEIPKCKVSDPNISDCMKNLVESLRGKMSTGVAEKGVPQLDPLSIPLINLSEDNEKFLLRFFNVQVTGLSDFIIEDLRADMKNLTMEIMFIAPKLSFLGEYKIKGELMFRIKLNTTGTANLTFWNVPFVVNIEGELVKGDHDKTYLFVNKLINTIEAPSKAYMKFNNIFHGSKEREEVFDNLINENWSSLFNMYKYVPEIGLTQLFQNITNNICKSTPFDEIFST